MKKGQVICDRRSSRLQLEAQRQVLKLKLATLQTPTIQPIQPEPIYAVELAKIDAARSQIQSLTAQIQQFESGSVYTPLAWSVLPLQEQRQQLFTLKQKLDQARIDLKLAIARFNQVKANNQQQVQIDQVKAALNQKQRTAERLQISQQLQVIETQMATTGKIKAPQAGIVKKLKWLGMQDQALQVELSLAMQGRDLEKSIAR